MTTSAPPQPPTWAPDDSSKMCEQCRSEFSFTTRRHHCRGCGKLFCASCVNNLIELPTSWRLKGPQKVCGSCYNFYSQATWNTENNSQIMGEGTLLAQYYVRDKSLVFKSLLKGIGRRKPPQKYFVVASHPGRGSDELLLAMTAADSDLINNDVAKKAFSEIMSLVNKHPFILATYSAEYVLEKKYAFTVRDFSPQGSLRDRIHKQSKPTEDFYVKYKSRTGTPLDAKTQIPYVGRQILEALVFLKSLGFPYAHLHTSNIIVHNKTVKLTDLESSLLGLSPLYLDYLQVPSEGINNKPAAEIICFGHVLFQLAMGSPLGSQSFHEFASRLYAPIYEILCMIFGSSGGNSGLGATEGGGASTGAVTLKDLLKTNYFASIPVKEDCYSSVPQRDQLSKGAKTLLKRTRDHVKGIIQESVSKRVEVDNSGNPSSPLMSPVIPRENGTATGTTTGGGTTSNLSNSKELGPTAADYNDPKYQGMDPNDPLHPLNREKAALRAKQARTKPKRKTAVPASGTAATTSNSNSSSSSSNSSNSLTGSGQQRPVSTAGAPKTLTPLTAGPAAPTSGPPPPTGGPLPPTGAGPPTPKTTASMPVPQEGRNSLLDSIRNPNNAKKLKKVDK